MSGGKPDLDAYRAELNHQTTVLTRAITDAVADALDELGETPSLNALAAALVNMQGWVLASVADPRHRKSLRRSMERKLPKAVAAHTTGSKCEVIQVDGRSWH